MIICNNTSRNSFSEGNLSAAWSGNHVHFDWEACDIFSPAFVLCVKASTSCIPVSGSTGKLCALQSSATGAVCSVFCVSSRQGENVFKMDATHCLRAMERRGGNLICSLSACVNASSMFEKRHTVSVVCMGTEGVGDSFQGF